MSFIKNKVLPSFCLIGDLGSELERNDLLEALLQNNLASSIKIQLASIMQKPLPDFIKPFVELWTFDDQINNFNLERELIKVYPFLYGDILDNDKYLRLFGLDFVREKVFRKQIGNFREKLELWDIYTAVILNTSVLAYVNMKDNLKFFRQENQLRLRRYGMNVLLPIEHKKIITPRNRIYYVDVFQFLNEIPLYTLFTKWLKDTMKTDLQIIFIEKECL